MPIGVEDGDAGIILLDEFADGQRVEGGKGIRSALHAGANFTELRRLLAP